MLDFEDITAFFVAGEFAQVITVESTGDEFNGIFDNGHNDFATAMGLNGSDTSPRLIVPSDAADLVDAGMTPSVVVIGGTRYSVTDKQPDITMKTYTLTLEEL